NLRVETPAGLCQVLSMRYWILLWLCTVGTLAYIHRGALSVPAKTIQTELDFDVDFMGLIMGCWFLGYAVLQIPSGWFADRWGSRRTLACFALSWSLLQGLGSLAPEAW